MTRLSLLALCLALFALRTLGSDLHLRSSAIPKDTAAADSVPGWSADVVVEPTIRADPVPSTDSLGHRDEAPAPRSVSGSDALLPSPLGADATSDLREWIPSPSRRPWHSRPVPPPESAEKSPTVPEPELRHPVTGPNTRTVTATSTDVDDSVIDDWDGVSIEKPLVIPVAVSIQRITSEEGHSISVIDTDVMIVTQDQQLSDSDGPNVSIKLLRLRELIQSLSEPQVLELVESDYSSEQLMLASHSDRPFAISDIESNVLDQMDGDYILLSRRGLMLGFNIACLVLAVATLACLTYVCAQDRRAKRSMTVALTQPKVTVAESVVAVPTADDLAHSQPPLAEPLLASSSL